MNSTEKYIAQNIRVVNLFTAKKAESVTFKTNEKKDVFGTAGAVTNAKHADAFSDFALPQIENNFGSNPAIFSPLPINPLETLSEEILNEARRYPKNLENEVT